MNMELELLFLMFISTVVLLIAGAACIMIVNSLTIVKQKMEQERLHEQFKEKLREEVKHDRM